MISARRRRAERNIDMSATSEREKIQRLFKSFQHGKFSARNRFVRAAAWLGCCDGESGALTPSAVSRAAEAAAGGAGTVVSEFAYVSREGRAATRQWGLDGERGAEEVRRLAQAVHAHGSRLIVQICHAGGLLSSAFAEGAGVSPSGVTMPGCDTGSRAMTRDDIERVLGEFAAAALRAKEGGADGVEIHGAHGFLVTQFLSPLFNKRTDEYGGSAENRARFLRELCAGVRAAVGGDFRLWVKLSVNEGMDGGYGPDDGTLAALAALASGADAVEVSSGADYTPAAHRPSVVGVSAGESEAPFAPYARMIRERAPEDAVVILTGGLRSLPVIAGLLDEGAADMFGLCRPFIAEPDLVNRWAEDDARPSACVSCNACLKTAARGPVSCPVMRDREEGEWAPL
ncbi:hypothetical protein B5F39_04765 [Cloacibacillus sp. An23]|nr:hypothetical protein B5F39_04765 [Cloacibacillus sp. An23]